MGFSEFRLQCINQSVYLFEDLNPKIPTYLLQLIIIYVEKQVQSFCCITIHYSKVSELGNSQDFCSRRFQFFKALKKAHENHEFEKERER